MEIKKIKYSIKYDRWVTKGGLVYRYSKGEDKLVLCKLQTDIGGYLQVHVSKPKRTKILVHRLVYETFVGEIPQECEIDHINTVSTDNRLENLRCVTHKENVNNPLTKIHLSEALKGKTCSEFGRKFKQHFGISKYENPKLYKRESVWYYRHNKVCRWEVYNERN